MKLKDVIIQEADIICGNMDERNKVIEMLSSDGAFERAIFGSSDDNGLIVSINSLGTYTFQDEVMSGYPVTTAAHFINQNS